MIPGVQVHAAALQTFRFPLFEVPQIVVVKDVHLNPRHRSAASASLFCHLPVPFFPRDSLPHFRSQLSSGGRAIKGPQPAPAHGLPRSFRLNWSFRIAIASRRARRRAPRRSRRSTKTASDDSRTSRSLRLSSPKPSHTSNEPPPPLQDTRRRRRRRGPSRRVTSHVVARVKKDVVAMKWRPAAGGGGSDAPPGRSFMAVVPVPRHAAALPRDAAADEAAARLVAKGQAPLLARMDRVECAGVNFDGRRARDLVPYHVSAARRREAEPHGGGRDATAVPSRSDAADRGDAG
ncbi:hypothetical protein DFJ73DRAFT_791982 [Zopfochytrium polystomum]|nr:hypothetical protein DFJ73DRAFT_791982 [Zopfochytrium polystomum]